MRFGVDGLHLNVFTTIGGGGGGTKETNSGANCSIVECWFLVNVLFRQMYLRKVSIMNRQIYTILLHQETSLQHC
jgi:hypothetical protein